MDKIEEGGTGLKYSEERTVYLTEIHEGEVAKLEITEEEREYNIETVNKVLVGIGEEAFNIFISLFGRFYSFLDVAISGDEIRVLFGAVVDYEGLCSLKITITDKGDAIGVVEEIQTGGSATSDFNNDFNNDF